MFKFLYTKLKQKIQVDALEHSDPNQPNESGRKSPMMTTVEESYPRGYLESQKSYKSGVQNQRKIKRNSKSRKIDKFISDDNQIIRKSLQSETYYRRHRQKARNGDKKERNESAYSSHQRSITPTNKQNKGSASRKRRRKPRRGVRPFEHIPLSFMTS